MGFLVYHAPLKRVLELSSMGIRVDAEALQRQLQTREKWQLGPFHERVLAHQLPLSIGGGIGQSRMCQYLLEKQHIGEVQASYWPPAMVAQCRQQHIPLL
jgi:aspartate--ammonia ligase